MTDLMAIAGIQRAEREQLLCKQQLLLQTPDAEKAEEARFMRTYRIRNLLNRLAPALAPRLGF